MSLELVVMAAGMGSRYGGLKQLDAFGPSGETLLEYSIFDALRAGFDRVCFIVRKDIEKAFKDSVVSCFEKRVEVVFVHQELNVLPEGFKVPDGRIKPWGTGHAVLVAQSVVKGPFAVINADDYYGPKAYQALAQFLNAQGQGKNSAFLPNFALMGYRLDRTLSDFGAVARGVCQVDSNGKLSKIVERTRIERSVDGICSLEDLAHPLSMTGNEPVSMNLWGFTPALFPILGELFESFLRQRGQSDPKAEFYLSSTIDVALKQSRASVTVLPTDESWFGVTYREDRPRVEREIHSRLSNGLYPQQLWG